MPRTSRARLSLALTALASLAVATLTAAPSRAAAADSSLTYPTKAGQTSVAWTGTSPFAAGQTGIAVDDPLGACDPTSTLNDQHTVSVTTPKGYPAALEQLLYVEIEWDQDPAQNNVTSDLKLRIFGPDGTLVDDSDGGQPHEGVTITGALNGVYNVLVCSFSNTPAGTDFRAKATVYSNTAGTFTAAKGVVAPTYRQYSAPKGVADNAGEPSIGANWKSGKTLFTSNTDEYTVAFDDKKGTSAWTLVNDDVTDPSNKISLDPIGFTDHTTGRTIVSQLYVACSASAYSDDDFDTVAVPSEGCGSGVNGGDHQTFGGGPFPEGVSPLPGSSYPHAVYYCAQAPGLITGGATCARSDDGSLTFGPAVFAYNAECSGIHGHVQVSPSDGTVYLPNPHCYDHQGVAVSADGGQTWDVRTIPDSLLGQSDNYAAVGSDGTLYVSYSDGAGHPRVAVSSDQGRHFTKSIDVGKPFGIRNSEFAMVVAGDGDRATVAFLGTPTSGSSQPATFGKSKDGKSFTGAAWHLYMSTTYDRGRTWTTVDATPKDPVQRGCVWNGGGGNPCRNLLDFDAVTIDKTGRVMVGFADGCVTPAEVAGNDCANSTLVSANKLVSHGAILRQISGKTLFKAYDAKTATPVTKPVTKPVATPAKPVATGGGLPATGGLPLLAVAGLVLLTGAGVARYRRTA